MPPTPKKERSQGSLPGFWRSGVWDLGSGIWGLGSGIWDLGSGIWDLGSALTHPTIVFQIRARNDILLKVAIAEEHQLICVLGVHIKAHRMAKLPIAP